jgi:hypothetical protein
MFFICLFGSSSQLKDEENGDAKWDYGADAVPYVIQGKERVCSQENPQQER